jgi:hypothetical protein
MPLDPDRLDDCRRFLREHANPYLVGETMYCRPLFPFDAIATLHFCSFVILDGEDEFSPRLVFEATFDGSKDAFFDEWLNAAPEGMRFVYRHCTGFSASALAAPNLMKEYLLQHDVGADTYFLGGPGRTVEQIKGENRVRNEIVEYLSSRNSFGEKIAGRSNALLEDVLRSVIRGRNNNQWAAQQAPEPWEIRFRTLIAGVAILAAFSFACGVGVLCMLFGVGPLSLHENISRTLEQATLFGRLQPAILANLTTLSGVWLVVRIVELLFSSASEDPRDQTFYWRFPLHLFIVFRYALMVFVVGTVMLAIIAGITSSQTSGVSASFPDLLSCLLIIFEVASFGAVLAALYYCAETLELSVQIKRLSKTRENIRRLLLDSTRFSMLIVSGLGALVVARNLSLSISEQIAEVGRFPIYCSFVIAVYAVIGIVLGYVVALLLLAVIRFREFRDKSNFSDPAELTAFARENAKKFAREEGGINTYQNHLASITRVKPGFLRLWLLRAALFVINLLSRFWFNRGDLGGIPTILSARWVVIDNGRRLLFLDNYGGAWESYLNEFIDMPAVKGLNAIWSNTFLARSGVKYRFPGTRFLFWQGAQDERPFKAYVRQSQVETIVWYGAYRTLSVINVNSSTALRQALSKKLNYDEIDQVFQSL